MGCGVEAHSYIEESQHRDTKAFAPGRRRANRKSIKLVEHREIRWKKRRPIGGRRAGGGTGSRLVKRQKKTQKNETPSSNQKPKGIWGRWDLEHWGGQGEKRHGRVRPRGNVR